MRRPEARYVARMHPVAAIKAEEVWHSRAIKMRSHGLRIFSYINIRFYNVTRRVHIIAEFTRDMILVLLNYVIMPGRGIETSFARGNSAGSNNPFAFIEIGALFGNLDHNFRSTRNVVTAPITASRRPAG